MRKYEAILEHDFIDDMGNSGNPMGGVMDRNQALAMRIYYMRNKFEREAGRSIRCGNVIAQRLSELRGYVEADGVGYMPGGVIRIIVDETIPPDEIEVCGWGLIKVKNILPAES